LEKFEHKMTEEEFEANIVSYGFELAAWPADVRVAGSQFIKTDVGKLALEKSSKMEQFAAQMRKDLRGQDGDASAFLARLTAIADDHSQQHQSAAPSPKNNWSVGSFVDKFFEPARIWSPAGLVSQGAFAAALLFAGVMVGANAGGTESFEDYDISSGLFEAADQEYSFDG